jgi:hypothetical protein
MLHFKQWLTQTAQRVDEGYPKNGQLVIDEQGQPRLKKLPTVEERASTKELESAARSSSSKRLRSALRLSEGASSARPLRCRIRVAARAPAAGS